MFSMKIHHGGMFTDPPGRMYVNGTESFIDNVDTDLFSVIELNDMIMMIGYRGDKKMYYKYMVPDSDLDNGLRALGSDQDVHDLSSYVLFGHKLINVYIEHGESKLDTYNPPPTKKCTVVELEDDVPVASRSVRKQLMLQWNDSIGGQSSVNEIGESSVANEVGKNTFPTEFTSDFYSTIDDQHFDPFFGLDDDEVVAKATTVEQTLYKNTKGETVHGKGKQHVVDEVSDDGKDCDNGEDSDKNVDVTDSEDSDYIADEVNDIDEVEVDMDNFHANVDVNAEFMGCGNLMNNVTCVDPVEVEVLDNDDFESGSEGEDDDLERIRKRQLKELRKQLGKNAEGVKNVTYFYVGKTFGTAKEAKDLIKLHSIETRRSIMLKKNDKLRIRVECYGTIPTLGTIGADNSAGPDKSIGPDNSTGPDKSSKKEKMTKTKIKEGRSPIKAQVINGGKATKLPKDPNKCPWALQISKCADETWSVRTYKA